MLKEFSNYILAKILVKDLENLIQTEDYNLKYLFNKIKEDSYYLYSDQNSEQLLVYMLNQTLKFAALTNIILKVMHSEKFKDKQKLLIIEKQFMIIYLTALFCLVTGLGLGIPRLGFPKEASNNDNDLCHETRR